MNSLVHKHSSKRIFLKLTAFILVSEFIARILLASPSVMERFAENRVVHISLRASRTPLASRSVVVLGDSVCRQIYDPSLNARNAGSLYSVACVHGISMVGQRILLEEILSANSASNIVAIKVVLHPTTLANDLRNKYAYSYFAKPFYNDTYVSKIPSTALRVIESYRGISLVNSAAVRVSNWCPEYVPFVEGKSLSDSENLISEISADEIRTITRICKERGIPIQFQSGVIRRSFQQRLPQYAKAIESLKLKEALAGYLESAHPVDDAQFVDAVHLKDIKTAGFDGMDPLSLKDPIIP